MTIGYNCLLFLQLFLEGTLESILLYIDQLFLMFFKCDLGELLLDEFSLHHFMEIKCVVIGGDGALV